MINCRNYSYSVILSSTIVTIVEGTSNHYINGNSRILKMELPTIYKASMGYVRGSAPNFYGLKGLVNRSSMT